MRLTISKDEAKLLRSALRIVRDSAQVGEPWSVNFVNDPPAAQRRHRRYQLQCKKELALAKSLLARLSTSTKTTKTV